jgi:hypothetical protein
MLDDKLPADILNVLRNDDFIGVPYFGCCWLLQDRSKGPTANPFSFNRYLLLSSCPRSLKPSVFLSGSIEFSLTLEFPRTCSPTLS